MGWTVESVRPDFVHHYSEDPTITRFVPHIPPTNPTMPPLVWAIEPAYAPLYWFPRDCPRVTMWAHSAAQRATLHDRFGCTGSRFHAAEQAWAERIADCRLYEYRFDATPFEPWDDAEGHWVASHDVAPLEVVEVGDLLARHAAAGIELRLVADLHPLRDAAVASDLPFSIVRFRNAAQR